MPIQSFEDIVNKQFKLEYQLDLEQSNEILIDNMVFPNYINCHLLNIAKDSEDYDRFEYYRIINKIFGFDYKRTHQSYYESNKCLITANDTVFDCGANTGIFSLYAGYKAKSVYSFEPSCTTRHYLRNSIKYNTRKNIHIVPFGVFNKNTKRQFAQTDNPGAARITSIPIPKFHKILYNEGVDLTTIDDFVKESKVIPTFIKMDIENGEIFALEGAQETIKEYKPKFSISIHELNINQIDYIKSLFNNEYNFEIKEEKYYDLVLLCTPKE